jgi:hypothetical protein
LASSHRKAGGVGSESATTASALLTARLPGLPFTSFKTVGVGFLPAAISFLDLHKNSLRALNYVLQ